jgi:broad specificity polyphosphatase/5'/3'-nucleotidase SurE
MDANRWDHGRRISDADWRGTVATSMEGGAMGEKSLAAPHKARDVDRGRRNA